MYMDEPREEFYLNFTVIKFKPEPCDIEYT